MGTDVFSGLPGSLPISHALDCALWWALREGDLNLASVLEKSSVGRIMGLDVMGARQLALSNQSGVQDSRKRGGRFS